MSDRQIRSCSVSSHQRRARGASSLSAQCLRRGPHQSEEIARNMHKGSARDRPARPCARPVVNRRRETFLPPPPPPWRTPRKNQTSSVPAHPPAAPERAACRPSTPPAPTAPPALTDSVSPFTEIK